MNSSTEQEDHFIAVQANLQTSIISPKRALASKLYLLNVSHIKLNSLDYSYGEEGYQIVVLALQSLFPERSFDNKTYTPLTWKAFIREYLLPETMILLIQEDLRISRTACIETIAQSREFGNRNGN